MPASSTMNTATSSPAAKPVTVALPSASGRPSIQIRPRGSLVVAVTVTVPAVASEVVTA